MSEARWGEYKHFEKHEFNCKETGENNMQHEFMFVLETIRNLYGKPMQVTSGYRSPKHSIEAKKQKPGEHTTGMAADILIPSFADRFRMLQILFDLKIPRIGIGKTYIHMGISREFPANVVWDYYK